MKKLFLIFLIVGVLVVAGYLFIRFSLQTTDRKQVPSGSSEISLDLRPLLIAKLKEMVKDGSDGLYNLSIQDIQTDILQSKLVLINARLVPDSMVLSQLENDHNDPDDVYLLKFPSLQINGIGLKDVLSKKNLDLDTIYLQQPEIEVFHKKRPYNKKSSEDSVTLYQRLTAHMNRISVKSIVVKKGTVVYHNLSKKKKEKFNNAALVFTGLLIDSSTQYDSSRFLFAKDATLSFQNYSMRTPDGLYDFTIGSVLVSAARHQLTILGADITPRYSKVQFQKKISSSKERYRVRIPKAVFRNIKWQNLLNEEGFVAGTADIHNAKFEVYLDRSKPSGSRMGKFPHQLLMKVPQPVHIARLNIHNTEVLYEEFSPLSGKNGKITVNKIDARVTNVTNIPGAIRRQKQAILTATARFMNRVPVRATIRFDLSKYKQGNFSANLHLAGFDASSLNAVSEPLGLLSIKSGMVKEVTANISGNNYHGSGRVLLPYNDLHIVALEKTPGEPGRLNKRKVFSFIANTFIIKKSNPLKDGPLRWGDCSYKRDPDKGFFNLVWKTMLTGTLKTVGANPEKMIN